MVISWVPAGAWVGCGVGLAPAPAVAAASGVVGLGAAVLAVRLYHHTLADQSRASLGALGECLFSPVGHLLDRHGRLVFLLVLLILAASIAGLWFTGRPVPGLPIE